MSDEREAFEKRLLKGVPEEIYLQWHGEACEHEVGTSTPTGDDVSWCVDKIFEHDIEYVRKDKMLSMQAESDELKAMVNGLREAVLHILCDIREMDFSKDDFGAMEFLESLDTAYDKSPSQSLAAHDAALIERVKEQAVDVCKEIHEERSRQSSLNNEHGIHRGRTEGAGECCVALRSMEVKP